MNKNSFHVASLPPHERSCFSAVSGKQLDKFLQNVLYLTAHFVFENIVENVIWGVLIAQTLCDI